MCGASGVLPWPLQAGGVTVWGMEGGGREGGYRGGAGGEALDGPGAVRGMVGGGDGNAQGQLTMVGGAYGLESNRSGRRWGPGVPSKCCHNVDARGEGGRWAGWNLPAWVQVQVELFCQK